MSEELKPRLSVPKTAKKGDVILIKSIVTHPMETGMRKAADGQTIPRKIINKFTCNYNGKEVFRAMLEPAISANPFISFHVRCQESGKLEFAWTDDSGQVTKAEQAITVS